MRALVALLLFAPPAHAEAWFCNSPLTVGDAVRSQYAFRLVLAQNGTFQADGRYEEAGFGWAGQYIRFEDQLALIGPLDVAQGARETRALSEYVDPDVMILNLLETDQNPMMIRCLRHDER